MTLLSELLETSTDKITKLYATSNRMVETSKSEGLDREIDILQAELRAMHTLANEMYYAPLENKRATGDVPHALLARIMEVNLAIVNQMLLSGF